MRVEPHRGVGEVIGPDHPLSRSLAASRTVARQAMVCAALLTGVLSAAAPRFGRAGWLAASAAVVELALLGLLAVLASERRRQARELIIERGRADLAELQAERQRLLAPAHRRQLAQRLQRALDTAAGWDAQLPASRPPPSVRNLLSSAGTVRAVVEALQADSPDLRGVALVDRLLDGGYGSPLYRDEPARLRAELARVAFQLGACVDHQTAETPHA
jgi:hypothetical protein